MNDFDTQFHARLAGELHAHAERMPIDDTDISLILTAGAKRQARHRTARIVSRLAAAALLVIGTVTVLSQHSNDKIAIVGGSGTDAATDQLPVAPPEPESTIGTTVVIPFAPTTISFGGGTPPPADPIAPVASTLNWQRADVSSTDGLGLLAYRSGGVVGDGPFYALSTAPGRTTDGLTYQPDLYRSDDALHWAVATRPDHSLNGIAASSGSLYAVGTASAAGTPNQPGSPVEGRVSRSADGGATWTSATIPIDPDDLANERGVNAVYGSLAVAAGSNGRVVVATTRTISFDLAELLPGVPTGNGWQFTADGVNVIGPPVMQPCDAISGSVVPASVAAVDSRTSSTAECSGAEGPITAYTWDQLGISQAVRTALNQPVSFWYSPDGTSFMPVDRPALASANANGTSFQSLISTDAGFVAVMSVAARPFGANAVLTSADGRAWQQVAAIPIDEVRTLGSTGELLVAYGSGFSDSARTSFVQNLVALSPDMGLTWQTTDLQGLLTAQDGPGPSLNTWVAGVGPHGVTIAGVVFIDVTQRPGGLSMSRNGITVTFHNDLPYPDFTDESTGQIIDIHATPNSNGLLEWADNGDTVLLAEDGSERLRITNAEREQLFADATAPYGADPFRTIVIHSDDGVNWSREWWSDISGSDGGGPEHVVSLGDRVIVSAVEPPASLTGPDASRPLPNRIVVVGTPKA